MAIDVRHGDLLGGKDHSFLVDDCRRAREILRWTGGSSRADAGKHTRRDSVHYRD